MEEQQSNKNLEDLKKQIQSQIEEELSLIEIFQVFKNVNRGSILEFQKYFKEKGLQNMENINEDHILQFFNSTPLLIVNGLIKTNQLKQLINFIPNAQKLYVHNTSLVKQVTLKYSKILKLIDFSDISIQFFSLVQMLSLEEVKIHRCYKLTYLQIIKCEQLKKFYLAKNFIKQIKLLDLPNLKQLKISKFESFQKYTAQNCSELINLDLSYNSMISNQLIAYICGFHPKLIKLDLNNSHFLKQFKLKNLKQLTCLNLKQCPNLQNIQLSQLDSLQRLNLYQCGKFSKVKIQKCRRIQFLNLSRTAITDNQLQKLFLKQLPQIKKLNLGRCKALNKINLNNLSFLTDFLMSKTPITDVQICNLKHLKFLSLSRCKKLIKIKLINCPVLQSINFIRANIYSQQIVQICQQCPHLSSICLIQSKSNIPKLKLQNFKFIKKVDIKKSSWLESISLLSLQNLQQVDIERCTALKHFQIYNCQKIKKLVSKSSSMNIMGIQFQKAIDSFAMIQELNFYYCYNMYIESVNISNFKYLKRIKFENCSSILHSLQCDSLPKLTELYLNSNHKLNSLKLTNCQKLKTIIVMNVSKQGIPDILKNISQNNFKNLKELKLFDVCIDNIEPITFIDMRKIKTLQLERNYITSIKPFSKISTFQGLLSITNNLVLTLKDFNKMNFRDYCKVFMNSYRTTTSKFVEYNIFKVKLTNRPRVDYEGSVETKGLKKMLDQKFKKEIYRNNYY